MRTFRKCEAYYAKHGDFIEQNIMRGPNCLKLIEVLSEKMNLKPGMKVLDMGCGTGLTSIFLAKEFGVTVFATDLWISATSNQKRFVEMGVDDKVFPIHAEAHNLPYAEDFFDAAINIDSYHYYGTDETYFPTVYAKLVKQGGQFGLVQPGLTKEFSNGLPEKMKDFWEPDMYSFHSAKWWHDLWEKTGLVEMTIAEEIPNGKAIWRENPGDLALLNADENDYLTMILLTATKKCYG